MSITQRKQEGDFTSQVDELIPRVESLALTNVQEALGALLSLEKQTRSASDQPSTSRILIAIVKLLSGRKAYTELREQITQLSKKHGQLRESIKKMVAAAMELLDGLKGEEKIKLLETLHGVTEGKIFLELERARLTLQLSSIKEAKGDIAEASKMMQDIAIETFGAVDRREKTSFILEQMRYLKLRDDWDKLEIISRKINVQWLSGEGNEELKLKYYHLLILAALRTKSYLSLYRHYLAIYRTPESSSTPPDFPSQRLNALKHALYFVVLAPYDNEQNDALVRLVREEKIIERVEWLNFAKCFTTPELMRWPGMVKVYGPMLGKSAVFANGKPAEYVEAQGGAEERGMDDGTDDDYVDLSQVDTPDLARGRWEDLHYRVIEHNIRVIATYYSRIKLIRLAELLSLPIVETEKHLSRLVIDGMIAAKIDRPAGTVVFKNASGAGRKTEEELNVWKGEIEELLNKVEKVGHLIGKEYAIKAAIR